MAEKNPTLPDGDRSSGAAAPFSSHQLVFWTLALLLAAVVTLRLPESGTWLGLKAFLMEVVGVALVVLVFSRRDWTADRVRAVLLAPTNLAVFGFLAWVGLSLALSDIPRLARYEALRYLGGGLIYFAALHGLSGRRQLRGIVLLIAAVGSLAAIAAFLNASEDELQRLSGAFRNQQLLAGFLCLVFPLVLIGSQREEETGSRIVLQVALVIIGAGLLVTQNRSAWLGAGTGVILVGALYLLYGRGPGLGLQKAQIILPVLIVALTVGLFLGMSRLSGSLSARAGTLSGLGHDNSFQWRLGMWSKALRMVRDRPALGWGVGSFPLQQALYPHPAVRGRTQVAILRDGPSLDENAHNTWLQLGAELGVPGLALFLAIYGTFFAATFRALRKQRPGFRKSVVMGAMGGVAAQAVCAFGSPAWEFVECSVFLWFMLAVGLVAAREGTGSSSRGLEGG